MLRDVEILTSAYHCCLTTGLIISPSHPRPQAGMTHLDGGQTLRPKACNQEFLGWPGNHLKGKANAIGVPKINFPIPIINFLFPIINFPILISISPFQHWFPFPTSVSNFPTLIFPSSFSAETQFCAGVLSFPKCMLSWERGPVLNPSYLVLEPENLLHCLYAGSLYPCLSDPSNKVPGQAPKSLTHPTPEVWAWEHPQQAASDLLLNVSHLTLPWNSVLGSPSFLHLHFFPHYSVPEGESFFPFPWQSSRV